MTNRVFIRRRFSKGKNAFAFSERSGMPYPYTEMIVEPGTGLRVHRSESDGKWNRVDMAKKPIIPAEPQALKDPLPGFDFRDDAPESYFD